MNLKQRACLFLSVSLILGLGAACSGGGPGGTEADGFRFETVPGVVRGEAPLLAIDDHLLPLRRNVSLYYSKPEARLEPVLTPSRDDPGKPDYIATHFYGTVLFDQGKYRMWYYALGTGETESGFTVGPVCYAESDDGIQWVKPNLGQVEYKGSRDNNALDLPGERMYGGHVLKDEEEADPERRYKMIYNLHNGKTWVFRSATSPDGIHWKVKDRDAVDKFIEIAGVYKHNGFYAVHGQASGHSEGGHPHGRQGYAAVSTNFEDWVSGFAPAFLIREPEDPAMRGGRKPYDQVHLGIGARSYGSVLVGLFGLWHNFPGDTTRNVPAAWFGHGKISADFGLVVSNDGIHFREPVKGHVYLHRDDSPVTNEPGKTYPTILCQSGNGILNVGDKTLIYHGRWRNAEYGEEYYAEVALATLPRDRWGALGLYPEGSTRLDEPNGWVWSAPVTLPKGGFHVVLNADQARLMKVEISDAAFNLLPEYSGPASGVPQGEGGLDVPVQWFGGDLAALAGQTVRLRIHMEREADADPRLYAVYLREND